VSVPQVSEAMKVLIARSTAVECPLYVTAPLEEYEKILGHPLRLGLAGNFQRLNAALSIALSHIWLTQKSRDTASHGTSTTKKIRHPVFPLDQYPVFELTESYLRGLADVRWPGRAQTLRLKGTNIVFFLDGAHTARATAHCVEWFTAARKDIDSLSRITELELPPHVLLSTAATTECIQPLANNRKTITVLVFNCNPPRDPKTLLAPIWGHTNRISEPFDYVLFTTNRIVIPGKKEIFNSNVQTAPNREDDLSQQQQMIEIWKSFEKMNSSRDSQIKVTKTLNEMISLVVNVQSQQQANEVHVLVTGSLYLVGGVLELLGYKID
jgi:folylpolyglutamate synthase